ncbi:hypothetical protein [Winogradskyella sp.]|uniref:hypothetical protein n=1 Tax=Winogradskyella sp. TaxID=1883156 RepID=UPI0035C7DA4A
MAFSFLKSKKNKSIDTVEAIIKEVENIPFGVSENNVLYAGLNELGGYYFFQTVIVGQMHIKTMNGAKLILKGEDITLELKSDSSEFESDPSSVKSRNITKIDFQIEENDIKTLQNTRIASIQLKAKKQDVLFTKYVSGDEEE